jgi:hypothetical protein
MLMLFRPSFCANCGEKIERAQWNILTSRRFCQVCESEFKGHDLVPRLIVTAGVLVGVFGFGSYLKSGRAGSETQSVRPLRQTAQQPLANASLPQSNNAGANTGAPASASTAATVPPSTRQAPAAGNQPAVQRTATESTVYYCGAATKKGTPCSRRVKGNTRCYQHIGMPAMASTGK